MSPTDARMAAIAAARADRPSADDRARIAAGLAARLAAVDGAGGHEVPGPSASTQAAAAGGAARGVTALAGAGGAALLVTLGAVAWLATRSAGDTPPPEGSRRAAAVEASRAADAERDAAAAPSTSGRTRADEPPGASVVAATSAPPAAASAPERARVAASTRMEATPARGAAGTTPAPAPPPRAPSLAEELAAVREARAAEQGGDPSRALALLDELDRRQPDGVLHEERRAARVVALCRADAPEASSEAARFLRELPSSIHAARVREACAPLLRP